MPLALQLISIWAVISCVVSFGGAGIYILACKHYENKRKRRQKIKDDSIFKEVEAYRRDDSVNAEDPRKVRGGQLSRHSDRNSDRGCPVYRLSDGTGIFPGR